MYTETPFKTMFLVGLTGSIATGKSTVSSYLHSDLKLPVVDADKIAKNVVIPGTKAWKKIRDAFGPDVFYENQELNREKLGQIIFNNKEKRKILNSITHPEIYKQMIWSLLKHLLLGYQFVVLDLPLLFETGNVLPFLSYTITVICTEEQQLMRLMTRNNFTEQEALSRIQSQLPLKEKVKKSTYVIDNSGNVKYTLDQVQNVFKDIQKSRKHWWMRLFLFLMILCFIFCFRYLLNIFYY